MCYVQLIDVNIMFALTTPSSADYLINATMHHPKLGRNASHKYESCSVIIVYRRLARVLCRIKNCCILPDFC